MKKIILTIMAVLGLGGAAAAQHTYSAQEMLPIMPVVPEGLDMQQDAKNALSVKLNQIVVQNGFGSAAGQFALVPNVIVVDKQMTRTAPEKYMIKLEVSLYVLDVIEQAIIAEKSFSLTGVDRLESRAIVQAMNQLNPRSATVRTFMGQTRAKIIDYYTTRLPVLVRKADALAEQGKYDEAYAILSSVPESVDGYSMILDRKTDIYKKFIEKSSAAALKDAQARIAAGDIDGAIEAVERIDAESSSVAGIPDVVSKIRVKASENADRDYELKLKAIEKGYNAETVYMLLGKDIADRVNAWYKLMFLKN